MQIENARGFKGDKEIVRVERERDNKGNLIENSYNRDGVCLITRVIEWAL